MGAAALYDKAGPQIHVPKDALICRALEPSEMLGSKVLCQV